MHRYGVRDVEKLLALPRSTIRALIEAGFVSPARGPRNAWLFSFQDLVVLRTAKALESARVPRKRITNALRQLRRHLPETMPLSGLSICAVADRVVVREGGRRWRADNGQYLLAFDGDPANGSLSVIENSPLETVKSAAEWFDEGLALEEEDPRAAVAAYEHALTTEPRMIDAHVNLGALLHAQGELRRAEHAYRGGIAACGPDPVLLFNLGVLLDDTGRKTEALEAYDQALQQNPRLADCHYNLALLYEELARPQDAIRHMAQYRRLVGSRPK